MVQILVSTVHNIIVYTILILTSLSCKHFLCGIVFFSPQYRTRVVRCDSVAGHRNVKSDSIS